MTINSLKNLIRNSSLILLTCAAFMLPMLSWGAQNCDNPANDFDGLYCLTKVYLEADKELNTSYSQLNKRLNNKQKAIIKRGQLAWIRERNNQCSYYDD